MNEVLHANIFFFITGIAVIVFTFLLSIALYHLIKVLKTIGRIADRVEAGTETLSEDIERVRSYVFEESFLSRFMRGGAKKPTPEQSGNEAPRKPSLRSLRPERRHKTEIKIKNEE